MRAAASGGPQSVKDKCFMKKIISMVLCAVLLITAFPGATAEAAPINLEDVGAEYYGRRMPFRPADKYTSEQNSPDFTWPYVENATYELRIACDKDMKNVERSITNLKTNYYTFPNPLSQTGKNYYWSVRYTTSAGTSDWSNPRRFRIDPNACEFTVPNADVLLRRIPGGHPRVIATLESLEDFRTLKDKSKDARATYDYYVSSASNYVSENILPEEPKRGDSTMNEANSAAREMIRRMQNCAYAYLLTGNEAFGRFAVKAAVKLSEWDYKDDSLNSYDMYKGNDQVHREIAYKTAMSYDWVYNIMTDSERKAVQDMIVGRLTYRYKNYYNHNMLDLTKSLPGSPFDSHGWTSIAYIGIIAYVLKDDVAEAEQWFKDSVPLYATLMPPWSYQDGGWCQGSSYWGWSTIESTKELSDVLSLGGVIDLYKKAVARNENLWTLYTYPNGTYGSFGDGSGGYLAEDFTAIRQSMYELAHFNNDGLALWIAQQQGGHIHYNIWNYYTADTVTEPMPPDNLPLGYCFNDVGWAVMTNDLKSADRIHMTFKSSRYGSFNHSHADQNAFVIQAYGKELAVNSGYYDSYNTSHDRNITRQSFAHNTITINGGTGQIIHDINAKGDIAEFVNHIDFDSVTGRAAEAYGGKLNRFDRNIVYLRPNVYIVVDDLEAKTGEQAEFEWRLNSKTDFSNIDGRQNAVSIKSDDVNLKTEIVYPAVTFSSNESTDPNTGKTVYKFISPIDQQEYPPSGGYENKPVQRMLCFKTEKTAVTKMVAVMSIYKDSEVPPEVTAENCSNYIKLDCGDKTVYANLKKSGEAVTTADGYEFNGSALTISESSVMLTNGTYLKKDGRQIISCSRTATVALGKGELSFSSDDDYDISIDDDNLFLNGLSRLELVDSKGRELSERIGVESKIKNTTRVFSCQKGNYTILEKGKGVISPSQLRVENVSVFNNKNGKTAICWNIKPGRNYDVKIGKNIVSNVTSPYYFDINTDVVSVSVRENLNETIGVWSDDFEYASVYENRLTGNVVFSDTNGKLLARTESADNLGNPRMFLCVYNSANELIECAIAEREGDYLAASVSKPTLRGKACAYIWDDSIMPIRSVSEYGRDSTDLSGIYADGELIDGFSNERDSYTIYFKKSQNIFPVLYAKPSDGATKIKINYDFKNFAANISIISPGNKKRTVSITFKNNPDNAIHAIKGAEIDQSFVPDSGICAGSDGKVSKISKEPIAYLDFTGGAEIECKAYTNLKGYEKGSSGSRMYSDRAPDGGNRLELETVPEFAKGADYIVLPYGKYYQQYDKADKNDRSSCLSFELVSGAEVDILTVARHYTLVQEGFAESNGNMQGRYVNKISPEDKYFNVKFNGKSEDYVTPSYYPASYDELNSWVNVSPLEGFDMGNADDTYQKYLDEQPERACFFAAGDLSCLITRSGMKFNYMYRKSFDAGEVRVNLSDLENADDAVVIIVKGKTPNSF